MKKTLRATIFCVSLLIGFSITTTLYAKTDKSITGTWLVNEEATETLQNKVRKSSSMGRGLGTAATVVLGVPSPGNSGPSGPNSTLKFPVVLECEEISFEVEEESVKASCASGVTREFLLGKIHGRITRFRRNILTESYSSTSRSVKHDIRVDKDGNLIAKVKIRPKQGISQTYVRVYSRPPETESETEEAESEVGTTEDQEES